MAKETENKKIKELKEKLFFEKKNACKTMSGAEIKKADTFCEGYKAFLDAGKTEREACFETVKIAKKAGFSEFVPGEKYSAGARVYADNRGKAVMLAVIGKNGVKNGANIIAAHIDSPRMDMKQNPLYEDGGLAYLKTHYYGGIKKYQWTAVPLALHGVIAKSDGGVIAVKIGEDGKEPAFCVTDLLPHLADAQYKRPANQLIKGEELNILIGSRPFKSGGDSDGAKLGIMKILNDKYGITERDFVSAELEAVPAFKARDVGFDRSLIGSYGQDDRVCAYTALKAITEIGGVPETTAVCALADKEEIGSYGNTGLGSRMLEYFMNDLADLDNIPLRRALSASKCLSADVSAGFDPTFPDVSEKQNAAYMNCGAVLSKFFGSRGKAGTNDASAEYTAEIRRMLEENGVIWQTAELGKVDAGGAGTVALFISGIGVDTIDMGVPVLSMHSPFEITAKTDIYMAYKAFAAFYARNG
ncbi:MAG: aminopeptidase [Oscillospiraceae bacterium]|jgi:aspartyl aminopeptidase|nr:aminopeptidase [Oscillospiraceae bacterium]